MLSLLGFGVCVFFIYVTSLASVVEILSGASWRSALLALVVGQLTTWVRAVRISGLLETKKLKLAHLYGGLALVKVGGTFLPWDVVLVWALKKIAGVHSIKQLVQPWLVLRSLDTLVLGVMFGVVSIAWPTLGRVRLSGYLPWAILVLAIVGCAGLLGFVRQQWKAMVEDGRRFWREKDSRYVWNAIGLACVFWLVTIFYAYLTLFTFCNSIPLWVGVLSAIAAVCVSSLPVRPPMALGTAEATWVFVLMTFGVTLKEAAAIAIGIRLLGIVNLVCHGLAGMWSFFCLDMSRNNVLPKPSNHQDA